MIDPHNPDIPPVIVPIIENSKEIKPILVLEQSKIIEWEDSPDQVLLMVSDKKNVGIVVHSENSDIKLGSTMKLTKLKLKPFVGGLTINSK